MNEVIKLNDEFSRLDQDWKRTVIGSINDFHIKVFKGTGTFEWHDHEDDEMVMVIKGKLLLKFPDYEVTLHPHEFYVIPAKLEHSPYTEEETHVMIFEKKTNV